jgi:hypothetical protein
MSGLQVLHGSELGKAMPVSDCAKSGQRVWQDVFSDESGQATVETLLLLGAVILPLAVGAYFWVDITRHLFSRNAKYLALPFP